MCTKHLKVYLLTKIHFHDIKTIEEYKNKKCHRVAECLEAQPLAQRVRGLITQFGQKC